ncbi:hypothetical protein AAMO2058_000523900 [Amorphochlora amoebiformis]
MAARRGRLKKWALVVTIGLNFVFSQRTPGFLRESRDFQGLTPTPSPTPSSRPSVANFQGAIKRHDLVESEEKPKTHDSIIEIAKKVASETGGGVIELDGFLDSPSLYRDKKALEKIAKDEKAVDAYFDFYKGKEAMEIFERYKTQPDKFISMLRTLKPHDFGGQKGPGPKQLFGNPFAGPHNQALGTEKPRLGSEDQPSDRDISKDGCLEAKLTKSQKKRQRKKRRKFEIGEREEDEETLDDLQERTGDVDTSNWNATSFQRMKPNSAIQNRDFCLTVPPSATLPTSRQMIARYSKVFSWRRRILALEAKIARKSREIFALNKTTKGSTNTQDTLIRMTRIKRTIHRLKSRLHSEIPDDKILDYFACHTSSVQVTNSIISGMQTTYHSDRYFREYRKRYKEHFASLPEGEQAWRVLEREFFLMDPKSSKLHPSVKYFQPFTSYNHSTLDEDYQVWLENVRRENGGHLPQYSFEHTTEEEEGESEDIEPMEDPCESTQVDAKKPMNMKEKKKLLVFFCEQLSQLTGPPNDRASQPYGMGRDIDCGVEGCPARQRSMECIKLSHDTDDH